MADSGSRSSYHGFVIVALDIARVERHVARGEVEPYPQEVIKRCGGVLLGMSKGEVMASSTLARHCFRASNPVPGSRISERVWDCAPRMA